jgi:hypothetical protein
MAIIGVDTPLHYLLYDTVTGNFIEELPFRGVSFSGGPVNQAGSWQGNFDLQDPGLWNTDWKQSTAPNKSTLIVDYGEQIVWGGVISGRKETFDESGFQLEIDAQEGIGWWSKVVQATDYSSPPYSGITGIIGTGMPTWNASFLWSKSIYGSSGAYGATNVPGFGAQPYIWDPMLIGAQIIVDALAVPGGQLWGGLQVNLNGVRINGASGATAYMESGELILPGASGVTWSGTRTPKTNYISINFPYTSLQYISSLLQQLTSLGWGVGFDAAVDYAYTGGNRYGKLIATLNFSYPQRGGGSSRVAHEYGEASDLYINVGNAHSWSFPEDGTGQGSINIETGGNQDIVAIENIYPTIGATGASGPYYGGYPNTTLVHNIANLNSPTPTNLLQAMGLSDSVLFSWPPVAPKIKVDMFNKEVGLGRFIVGDNVYVSLPKLDQDGKLFDPRFPAGLAQEWRIVSYNATVPDEGDCLIEFGLDSPLYWVDQSGNIVSVLDSIGLRNTPMLP